MQDLSTLLSDLKSLESEEQLLECSRLEMAIRKGHLLLAIKSAVPHGQFAKVLKEHGCNTSVRTAQRQMKLAANEDLLKANTTDLSQMTLSQALNLLKKETSTPCEEEVLLDSFELSYRSQFIPSMQSYEIAMLIPITGIPSMTHKKNLQKVLSRLRTILQEIQQNPSLTDLYTISKN